MTSWYLVRSTVGRLAAYRRYREQTGEYWGVQRLERFHWEFLYARLPGLAVRRPGIGWNRYEDKAFLPVRQALCEEAGIAEELLLLLLVVPVLLLVLLLVLLRVPLVPPGTTTRYDYYYYYH